MLVPVPSLAVHVLHQILQKRDLGIQQPGGQGLTEPQAHRIRRLGQHHATRLDYAQCSQRRVAVDRCGSRSSWCRRRRRLLPVALLVQHLDLPLAEVLGADLLGELVQTGNAWQRLRNGGRFVSC
ncbi:hypothetical protein D9M69_646600 [compost metagenome]